MKYVIAFGLAIMVVLASAAAYVYYGLTHRPDLSSFVALTAAPDINRNAPLRVTFLGVSTLLFDDGSTAILLDGFFTRPNSRQLFLEKISPDKTIIKNSLQRAGIDKLAAVIVNHSHYDHAMDAPEVAAQTGAVLVGSEFDGQCWTRLGLAGSQHRGPPSRRHHDLRPLYGNAVAKPARAVALHRRRNHSAAGPAGARQRLS